MNTTLNQLTFKRFKRWPIYLSVSIAKTFLLFFTVFTINSIHAIEWQGDGFATLGAGIVDVDSINHISAAPNVTYEESIKFDIDSKIGYQVAAEFHPRLSATVQAVVRGIDNYDPNVDWAYISFKANEDLFFKLGRMIRSAYKYSDYINVGYAYPWVRPPMEVYSRTLSFFEEIDAVNVQYTHPIGDWAFAWESYYGNSSSSAVISNDDVSYRTRDDMGILLNMENGSLHFRLGYHVSNRFNAGLSSGPELIVNLARSLGYPEVADDLEIRDLRAEFYNVAASYDRNNWFINAEGIRLNIERSAISDEDAWYLNLGRQFGSLSLHYTYANTYGENNEDFVTPILEKQSAVGSDLTQALLLANIIEASRSALKANQNSHTFGVRYDFEQPVALKFETLVVKDKANNLKNHFFSLALDFIF